MLGRKRAGEAVSESEGAFLGQVSEKMREMRDVGNFSGFKVDFRVRRKLPYLPTLNHQGHKGTQHYRKQQDRKDKFFHSRINMENDTSWFRIIQKVNRFQKKNLKIKKGLPRLSD